MSSAAGGGGRIVLNPEDLRRVATKMRGASVMLSLAGRELAARPMPSMPPGVGSAVTEVVARADAELQDLALELLQETGMLLSRATWAELGGGDAVAWMIPGLQHAPSTELARPGSVSPPVTEEQIIQSERWATSLLDELHESVQLLDDQAASLGAEVDEVLDADLIRFADGYADEILVTAPGAFTMTAGIALEVHEHYREGISEAVGRAGVSAGMGAAGGALGVAVCEVALGWTGVGLVGCLVVGGAAGSRADDQVDDEVSSR